MVEFVVLSIRGVAMRSEVRLMMLPEDEDEFLRSILDEPGTVLVDGPRWDTPEPPIASDFAGVGPHLLVWKPSEHPKLAANRHEKGGSAWWYCRDERATIQFLRCRYRPGDRFVSEGRLAVATTERGERTTPGSPASPVERRFLALRRRIHKVYTNRVIIWQNRSLPRSRTNPLKPDPGLWVGPRALRWLEDAPEDRWVQVVPGSHARGYLLDLVP
jgi:hypothetical protein